MENLFSSQVIQVLKDNFVGKQVGCEHFEGEIVDIVNKPVVTLTNGQTIHFHIKISISESVFITYDDLLRLNVKSLPAEEKKDSNVRYINKTVFDEDVLGYIEVGTEVNVIDARTNEYCDSGVEVFIEVYGLKTSICASLLTCDKP